MARELGAVCATSAAMQVSATYMTFSFRPQDYLSSDTIGTSSMSTPFFHGDAKHTMRFLQADTPRRVSPSPTLNGSRIASHCQRRAPSRNRILGLHVDK